LTGDWARHYEEAIDFSYRSDDNSGSGAFGLARFLETLLFQIKPADAMTFTFAPALLLGVALLAYYIPARRATKVDPINALHCEQLNASFLDSSFDRRH
jgi:ABC-type lipoprotein release transport system permease subunit